MTEETWDPAGDRELRDGSVLVDRAGDAWTLTRDGGMLTRATHAGIKSVGVAWAAHNLGPLRLVYAKE